MFTVAKIIHWGFLSYTMVLFASIVGSWFPKFSHTKLFRFARFYTDPYLNIFRRFIPPIGGALDLSPILGFFTLEILERIIVGCIRAFF